MLDYCYSLSSHNNTDNFLNNKEATKFSREKVTVSRVHSIVKTQPLKVDVSVQLSQQKWPSCGDTT